MLRVEQTPAGHDIGTIPKEKRAFIARAEERPAIAQRGDHEGGDQRRRDGDSNRSQFQIPTLEPSRLRHGTLAYYAFRSLPTSKPPQRIAPQEIAGVESSHNPNAV